MAHTLHFFARTLKGRSEQIFFDCEDEYVSSSQLKEHVAKKYEKSQYDIRLAYEGKEITGKYKVKDVNESGTFIVIFLKEECCLKPAK